MLTPVTQVLVLPEVEVYLPLAFNHPVDDVTREQEMVLAILPMAQTGAGATTREVERLEV